MFEALRAAYDEHRSRPPPLPQSRPATSVPSSIDVPVHYEPDEPSAVVDVAFGETHEDAMERERQRTREVIEGLSGPSIAIALEALNKT